MNNVKAIDEIYKTTGGFSSSNLDRFMLTFVVYIYIFLVQAMNNYELLVMISLLVFSHCARWKSNSNNKTKFDVEITLNLMFYC